VFSDILGKIEDRMSYWLESVDEVRTYIMNGNVSVEIPELVAITV